MIRKAFFSKTVLLLLAVLCSGCGYKKSPNLGNDPLGIYNGFISSVYTRSGTNIRIDILHSLHPAPSYEPGEVVDPNGDFSSMEISLITQTLDSFSTADLIQSGVRSIGTERVGDVSGTCIPLSTQTATSGVCVTISSQGDIVFHYPWLGDLSSHRPEDPNIGSELSQAIQQMLQSKAVTGTSTHDAVVMPSVVATPAASGSTYATPLEKVGVIVTSPYSPKSYIPITSNAGMQAVIDDYTLGHSKDPNHKPTRQDQARPHGPVQIINTYNP